MVDQELLIKELNFITSRSSGKGGQNVNKVETKVELRFDVLNSSVFTEEEKERIQLKMKNRISNEGIVIISSDSERTQLGNKRKVIDLFMELIEKALIKPKKRIKTKPTKTSKEKRLKEKKIQSDKKQFRKNI